MNRCRAIEIGLSCLRKVEEIVNDNCLPDRDYYVLPMKLPNRMFSFLLLLIPFLQIVSLSHSCYDVTTIDRSIRDNYCDQPMFVTFLEKSDEAKLMDNICFTFFPLPDDPDTFQLYISRVYCDGSNDIISYIESQLEVGVARQANPYLTANANFFGYAGCDTYLVYRCALYGYGDDALLGVYGLSPNCRAIGLSCLRKVEEIVKDNCLPDRDYYVLPMKLPNRCVTQQLCLQPPNPFFGAAGLAPKLPGISVI